MMDKTLQLSLYISSWYISYSIYFMASPKIFKRKSDDCSYAIYFNMNILWYNTVKNRENLLKGMYTNHLLSYITAPSRITVTSKILNSNFNSENFNSKNSLSLDWKEYCKYDLFKFFLCNFYSSCCVHITDGVNIYLCVCQSIGPCVSCVCLSVCDIKLEH